MSEAESKHQWFKKQGLETSWLQPLKEEPAGIFSYVLSAKIQSSLAKRTGVREERMLVVDRILSKPPVLTCRVWLNGESGPELSELFERLSPICRKLEFEELAADANTPPTKD